MHVAVNRTAPGETLRTLPDGEDGLIVRNGTPTSLNLETEMYEDGD